MKLVIFAGGIGTRLWPLSRKNSPKQFDKIFNGKSTLQLAVERVAPFFGMENTFIQTTENFQDNILDQIDELGRENIFIEPARKNIGPAVCLAMRNLKTMGHTGAVAILWADHLVDRLEEFIMNLKTAEKLVEQNSYRFIFLGERPRFANNNLGWIHTGKKISELNNIDYYEFAGWKYKPDQAECDQMFKSGEYFWYSGYFISSIDFILDKYKELSPDTYNDVINNNYLQTQAVHFDRIIAEKLKPSEAVVLKTNMGWSDPGTLYALKEALQKNQEENVVKGRVVSLDSKDCLIYNLEEEKLVTAVGLEGMVVVNTPDAIIVVPKGSVKEITDLVKEIEKVGMDKYL